MKKFISLLLVALVAGAMLIPVSAEAKSTNILKGTPTFDGAVDDIYTQSMTYDLDNFGFYVWGDTTAATDQTATAYMLWDESYLYIAIKVKDSTFFPAADPTSWQNDSAEMWFVDEDMKFKIHECGDGTGFFVGTDADGATPFDFTKAKQAVAKTDDGYSVEIELPMNKLAAGKTFTFSLQVNDVTAADGSSGSASGSQNADAQLTCVADAAVTTAIETEAAPETTAAPAAVAADTAAAETAAPAAAATAAQTSDNLIAVFAAIAAIAAGFVVFNKKK